MYKLIKNGCISCGKSKRRFGSGLIFFLLLCVSLSFFWPEVYGYVLFVKVSKQYVCEIFYWRCSFVDGTRIIVSYNYSIQNSDNSLILFFVLNCELMDSNSVVIDLCENAEHFVFMYVGIGFY